MTPSDSRWRATVFSPSSVLPVGPSCLLGSLFLCKTFRGLGWLARSGGWLILADSSDSCSLAPSILLLFSSLGGACLVALFSFVLPSPVDLCGGSVGFVGVLLGTSRLPLLSSLLFFFAFNFLYFFKILRILWAAACCSPGVSFLLVRSWLGQFGGSAPIFTSVWNPISIWYGNPGRIIALTSHLGPSLSVLTWILACPLEGVLTPFPSLTIVVSPVVSISTFSSLAVSSLIIVLVHPVSAKALTWCPGPLVSLLGADQTFASSMGSFFFGFSSASSSSASAKKQLTSLACLSCFEPPPRAGVWLRRGGSPSSADSDS